jgi:ABC-type multidrug transport system ATPase subunit/ABC-type multidrug transport system permease subunit
MAEEAEETPNVVSTKAEDQSVGIIDKESQTNASSKSGADVSLRKSSLASLKESRNIPIVELTLEKLTYMPITSTAMANKQQKGNTSAANRTTVLSGISTKISPYQLTAWMGPSGSGKSSLASVVAGLVDPSDLGSDGLIKVNGEEGRIPKRLVGVVWQDDLLLSNLTVEETIYFAARLKTPCDVADDAVKSLVKEIMEELGLWHIRDNLIGSALTNMPGISGGERKRAAVAAELVARPSMLILDEPTSGLDATTARSLMATLKDLVNVGHSIAVVIHQPRTDIYKMIDHLLLLSKGRVLYDGPAAEARSYLESCPAVGGLPEETGIADWIMDMVIDDEKKEGGGNLASRWVTTQAGKKQETVVATTSTIARRMSTLSELHNTIKKYEAPFSKQLQLLTSRTHKQRRGDKITKLSVMLTFIYVVFTCLFWWQLPDDTSANFQRTSLLFFTLIAQGNSVVVGSLQVFASERSLLRRERAKKMYGVLPFFIAKTASDMTNNVALPCLYGIIIYFCVGLRLSVVAFLQFVLAYYLTLSTAQSMGFLMSILIPNMRMALIIAPPLTLFMFILGGFYIPISSMHVGIRWASYISFARYGYSAILINEFQDRDVPCGVDVVIDIGGSSGECPLPGEVVYESMGLEGVFTSYWFNLVVVGIMQVVFLTAAYALLRRSK